MRSCALALVLLTACAPDAPLRWESAHFTYKAQSEPMFAEADQIAAFEHHYDVLSRAMGVSIAEGDRAEYRQSDDPKDPRVQRFRGLPLAAGVPLANIVAPGRSWLHVTGFPLDAMGNLRLTVASLDDE